jgi:hypothetical protein
MIYVASPYSHSDHSIRFQRYLQVREFVWLRMQMGETVISPIVYGHQFARDFSAPIDAHYWESFNLSLFLACNKVYVLKLAGWEKSYGIAMEIAWAESANLPIEYHEPLEFFR